jgi:predicted nucleotidyltransferase
MAKTPKDPKEIFEEFTADYKEIYGDDLVSIVLYGSGATTDYRPGKSNLNFIIVLTDNGIENLDKAFPLVKKWRKKKVGVPLFLTEDYLNSSLDVYPIEYLGFQRRHMVVYGKNILEELHFDRECLRLQCEREIKGKLLLLRHAYLESEGRGSGLKQVAIRSIPAFLAIFEGLLHLKDETVPVTKREVIRAGCEAFSLESKVFDRILAIREGEFKPDKRALKELFKQYLNTVRSLALLVDRMEK